MNFRDRKTTRFATGLDAWARARNTDKLKCGELRWLFESTKSVFENDTLESLDMGDGDQIGIFEPQRGCREVDNCRVTSTIPKMPASHTFEPRNH